jgi:hypothetical protein
MELVHFAEECGWFGWSRGPGPEDFLEYRCGCDDGHHAFVTNTADDPDYYRIICDFIGKCRT